MDEFTFIKKYLAPLTFQNPAALGLMDDAAVLPVKAGFDTIITKDAIAQDTHFFKNDNPANIARKLLRVNLSDLAAKGAEPYCCFLALLMPKDTSEDWLKTFSQGLHSDLQEFNFFLAGGDTVIYDGPVVLTLTAIGYAPTGKVLKRNGAKAGDLIFVSGTIGDSYLGLKQLQSKHQVIDINVEIDTPIGRYLLPDPRIKLGIHLRNIANSSADISDGLYADLSHICECSNIGAEIFLEQIPLSDYGRKALREDKDFIKKAITSGDDYELVFTAPANLQEKIAFLARELNLNITEIGKVTQGNEINIIDKNGEKLQLQTKGYTHSLI